jgi:SAM-dependent methyltransferase
MSSSPSRVAHEGYAALAPFYDEFVAHPGYRRWVLSIERTARDLGAAGVRLLDLGCGTGRSFAPLVGRGYLVTGCDPVAAMLAEARRRSPRRVRTACGLAADAPAGPYDLVLALNDVVNCHPDGPALRRTLIAVAQRLAPGGVFAFDVTPPASHARAFEAPHRRVTARARFAWDPVPAGEGHHTARLRVHATGRPEAVTLHHQRVLERRELLGALAEAGLRVAAVRGCDNDGHVTPVEPHSFKHIYFTELTDPPRHRKEGLHAQGAQAAGQGAGLAVDDQAGVSARVGAATEPADGR